MNATRFVQVALKNESLCATKSDGGAEDGEIGKHVFIISKTDDCYSKEMLIME